MRVNSSILRSKRRIPLLFGLFASLFLALLFWSTPANAVPPTTHVSDGATSVSAPMAVASPLLFIGEADTNVNTTADDEEIVCIGGALGYIVCPLIDISITMIKTIAAFLDVIFNFQALNNTELRAAWSIFVNLANIFLAIGFLAIVISQTTSIGISNYGIKRMLPRVVAAAIMINMSFYVAALAVDISNVLGKNMLSFMTSFSSNVEPAGDPGAALGNSGASTACRVVGQAGGGVAGGVAGNLAGSIFGIPGRIAGTFWGVKKGASFGQEVGCTVAAVGLALTGGLTFITIIIAVGLIAVFIAFITTLALAFMRYVILIFLVVLAPLAFAAWVLPNTDKYFYKWWTLFIKLLMIYPIAMFLFGGSIFAADVIGNIAEINNGEFVRELFPGSGAITEEAVRGVWAVVQLFIIATPLFIIPKLFKGLDSVTGGISGKMAAAGSLSAVAKAGQKRYQKSAIADYRKQRKVEDYALAASGNYKGRNPIVRGQQGVNKLFRSVSPGYDRQTKARADSLIQKREAEEAAPFNKHYRDNQFTPGVGDSSTLSEIASSPSSSQAQRRAALEQLSVRQDFDELKKVKEAGASNPEIAKAYSDNYARNAGSMQAAPHLNPAHQPKLEGGWDAFGKMSPEKAASLHSSAIDTANEEAFASRPVYQADGKTPVKRGDTTVTAPNYNQQLLLSQSYEEARNDPQVRRRLDNKQLKEMETFDKQLESQATRFLEQRDTGYAGIDPEEAKRREDFLNKYTAPPAKYK